VIVAKENVTRPGADFDVDFDDRSITRSDAHYRDIFAAAGCELVAAQVQRGFPDELFPVHMWAVR
jgi:protein N-terminal methyltransferase